jgi:hypothetical protein
MWIAIGWTAPRDGQDWNALLPALPEILFAFYVVCTPLKKNTVLVFSNLRPFERRGRERREGGIV